jgi:hypothetical protein
METENTKIFNIKNHTQHGIIYRERFATIQCLHCWLDDLSIGNEKSKLVDDHYIFIQTLFRLTMWNGFWKKLFYDLSPGL